MPTDPSMSLTEMVTIGSRLAGDAHLYYSANLHSSSLFPGLGKKEGEGAEDSVEKERVVG